MVAITGEFTGLSISRDEFEAPYLSDEDTGDLTMKGPYVRCVVRV